MIKDTILTNLKTAMKARDMEVVSVLRFLLSEIKNVEIDAKDGQKIDDEAIQKIISKQVKQMRDALDQFTSAGRSDLAQEEQKKISILEQYMPEQMSEDELRYLIKSVVDAAESSDMGQIMKAVMAKVKNAADGKQVSRIVREVLNNA